MDAKPAFTLVEYSTEESSEPTDPSLSVADITLSTGNLAYGITIEDVFSGEDGGTIQEGDIVPVLRDGVLTRASQAAISTSESGGGMVYKGIIHKAVPANPRKGYAYIFRGLNLMPVFVMYDIRALSEYVRFFKSQTILLEVKENDPTYKPLYRVYAYYRDRNHFEKMTSGVVFESPEETEVRQKELIERYMEHLENIKDIFYIQLDARKIFPIDAAVFVGEDGLGVDTSYIHLLGDERKVEMVSTRFFIENNKVYCKEIPSISCTTTDDEGETVLCLANRVNVLRQKKFGHNSIRYNHWLVESDEIISEYTNIKKAKRYPIKLVCGETKAFIRRNRKYRGCSIHSIESNGMHILNEIGGGNVY